MIGKVATVVAVFRPESLASFTATRDPSGNRVRHGLTYAPQIDAKRTTHSRHADAGQPHAWIGTRPSRKDATRRGVGGRVCAASVLHPIRCLRRLGSLEARHCPTRPGLPWLSAGSRRYSMWGRRAALPCQKRASLGPANDAERASDTFVWQRSCSSHCSESNAARCSTSIAFRRPV